MRFSIALLLILFPLLACCQNRHNSNKYSIGIRVDAGHSFPNFSNTSSDWKGTFYPAGGINLMLVRRFNQNWTAGLGAGVAGYALTNRGPIDKYILDFASPTLTTEIGYIFMTTHNREGFLRLSGGIQLAYQKVFEDQFETYTVSIEGENLLLYFIQPELGIRRYFKQKMKVSRFKTAYEFGVFFRYNFNRLGTATISSSDYEVVLTPSGNIMGAYFKILFPIGNKRFEAKPKKEKPLPPIIYNPRFKYK
ncbi:MAG: hypothetical protein GYB31_14590 [Bacteroidetes bacterium]|nr:hypothetical protein [Bacteroidota bacterium]